MATTSCTDTYTETFAQDNLPEKCEGHGVQKICTESGKLATQYCPQTRNSAYGGTVPKEALNLWNTTGGSKTAGGKITETCTIHTKPTETPKQTEKPVENTVTNTTTTKPTATNTTTNTNTETNKTNTETNTNTEKPKNDTIE